MFMRNTMTLFHGRTCIVCAMTMGDFPLSTSPKSNYFGWLYDLFACFSNTVEIFFFLVVTSRAEIKNSSIILESLLLETCNNAQLRRYLQHMHLELKKNNQSNRGQKQSYD